MRFVVEVVMKRGAFTLAILLLAAATGASASAQETVSQSLSDPSQWHPIIYNDFSSASSENAAYVDLWAEDLAANDKAYARQGDTRFRAGHAPATESHMVVRGTDKTAVISILNTATGCTTLLIDQSANLTVKLCPLKVAIYVGNQVTVTTGRKGCFLEVRNSTPNPKISGTFVGYDITNKAFRLGTLIDHQPVSGCSANIPLYDRLVP